MKYINDFLTSLVADGKSKCTVNSYRIDLMQFESYIKKDFAEIKFSDLREWANSLTAQNLAATSRARKISAVKSFFKYLYKMEVISKNPAEFLETPKLEKKQPKVISEEDASEILFHARNDGDNQSTYMRDLALLMTMLYTGVRREELTNIKLQDINLKNSTILIHGKGNKQRNVFIGQELLAVLSEYIYGHRKLFKYAEDSEYLFVSLKSGQLSIRAVSDIANKYMERAGCKEKGKGCHQFRRRTATSVFNNTHDIIATQRLLGHSSPTTTQRYIAIDDESMLRAATSISF